MSDDRAEYPSWYPTPEEDASPETQQETIIDSDAYPMRVLAGAGTGKTFTMVRKVEHLIDEEGVSPDRILALTFTNNAADSMREKLNAKLGTAGYDIDAYTYHSICNEILTDYAYEAGLDPDFEVATDAEKYAIVLDVLDEIEYRSVKPNVYGSDGYASGAASKLLGFIGSMKRSGITPDDIDTFLGPAERVYTLADLPERIETIAGDHLGGRSVSTVGDSLPDVRATSSRNATRSAHRVSRRARATSSTASSTSSMRSKRRSMRTRPATGSYQRTRTSSRSTCSAGTRAARRRVSRTTSTSNSPTTSTRSSGTVSPRVT
nr:UvrD-helicase domain-containing protein [Halarchaeum acidiphilum]